MICMFSHAVPFFYVRQQLFRFLRQFLQILQRIKTTSPFDNSLHRFPLSSVNTKAPFNIPLKTRSCVPSLNQGITFNAILALLNAIRHPFESVTPSICKQTFILYVQQLPSASIKFYSDFF